MNKIKTQNEPTWFSYSLDLLILSNVFKYYGEKLAIALVTSLQSHFSQAN